MTTQVGNDMGSAMERQLLDAVREVDRAPIEGARDLPVIEGVPQSPGVKEPLDNKLLIAIGFLIASARVYLHENRVMLENLGDSGGVPQLIELSNQSSIRREAPALLANVFICSNSDTTAPPPAWFVVALLCSDLLLPRLPRITMYARRPIFSTRFALLQPGWHPDDGVLIHGLECTPIPHTPDTSGPAIGRLPIHLATLLREFCFRSSADLANYLGILLTAVLSNHFVQTGKAIGVFDGNQPGLGKSLLARIVGVIADGVEPPLVSYTAREEELEKRLGAEIRRPDRSVIVIDNAKSAADQPIESSWLEANAVAPNISFRILGASESHTRVNDMLFLFTANNTRLGQDLMSRSVICQLELEGPADARRYTGPSPTEYAASHRTEILAELCGMVARWIQAGCPLAEKTHRLQTWAQMIGGILEHAGFSEFLANASIVAASVSAALEDLTALAEECWKHQGFSGESSGEPAAALQISKSAADWIQVCQAAQILRGKLTPDKPTRSMATSIGQFLRASVGQEVSMDYNGRQATACLRCRELRQGKKAYAFEIRATDHSGESEPDAAGCEPDSPACDTPSSMGPVAAAPLPNAESAGSGHPLPGEHPGNTEEW